MNYTIGNDFDNCRVFERHILGTELEFGEDGSHRRGNKPYRAGNSRTEVENKNFVSPALTITNVCITILIR